MKDNEKKGTTNRIVLLTGELSGEIHGTNLVKSINSKYNIDFSGMGGRRLKQEGMEVVYDYNAISLMGISEIFTKTHHIISALNTIKRHIRDVRPLCVILVDFPGFNLRIAGYAKRLGIPVIYFIPPQVWAWHRSRVYKIKKYVDLVISILPFEKGFYREYGIEARYVGHPFANIIKPTMARDEFFRMIDIDMGHPLITIMPGSRENEVLRHMPVLLSITDILKKRLDHVGIVLPVAENIPDRLIKDSISGRAITALRGYNYDALYHSDAAIIASGSATLEAAILGVPTAVIYKISTLSYLLAKMLVDVKFISLPNLIAGKEVFPEFIQHLDPEKIAERVIYMLNNDRVEIKKDLAYIKAELGGFDSYSMARDEIVSFLEHRYGTIS
ncbi:MAG TPA: lipid-A-disaccharide synthase [Syntrophorhabdaceae bacterium]|nr:lipid-A-disaccharide synthase [Syntrophorhabdaceae bacterium]HOL05051.1 lipid-A-disaccharide synthase [Syntrophorhabdaceae bacterium]HOT41603.1 lipid-A-disaccharide synthase [Syntrophorhabdaceae bacterium]HPC66950.1 lipid-A-disaccharide synthase [Syntrophorhabdaceae bacterium]HPP41275.1 lipid-A-disaccharide synthase [Syntrophorhabdaceae bacterium]